MVFFYFSSISWKKYFKKLFAFRFGTSKRDDPLHELSKTVPGPGNYTSKSIFDKQQGAGISMVPKRPDSAFFGAKTPGPGSYNPSFTNK